MQRRPLRCGSDAAAQTQTCRTVLAVLVVHVAGHFRRIAQVVVVAAERAAVVGAAGCDAVIVTIVQTVVVAQVLASGITVIG
ncbi:hypothetical protein D3C78_1557660 [compost metagenome]